METVPLSLKTKRELAHGVLDELFGTGTRLLVAEAIKGAEAQGVGYRTLRRVAAEDYKVTTIRQGSAAGIWERLVQHA